MSSASTICCESNSKIISPELLALPFQMPTVVLTDKEGSPRRSRETSAEALIRAANERDIKIN